MNKLPEKLVLLRKYYNLSQGDIAQKLNIPVTEYMQWENGNTICSIQQLKLLADLFGIVLDDLLDNTKTIVIPEPKIEQSVNIPFHGGQDINATQMYGDEMSDTMQTQEFGAMQDDLNADASGRTRVMDTSSLAKTAVDDEEDEEDDDEEIIPRKPKKKIGGNLDKKKQTVIIISAVAVAVIVIALVILFMNNAGSSLKVGNDNRVALGDTYSLYVDNQGNVKKYGQFNPSSTGFSNAVQVSAFDDHAAALLSNGKVVSSDDNSDVKDWKNIKYISAGKDHTVGVTSEGKVECAGNESACKVSGWSNIATVYAGNGFTIGLTNDGAVKASGNNTEAVSSLSNVRHISVSDSMIVVTKKDGTVTVYPIGSSAPGNTDSWADIQSTAAGSNLVAGLKKDGTVNVLTDDTELSDKVASWKNIKHIAANGSTLIAIDSSGKMHGAGDNSYSQYVDSSDTKEDDSKDTLDEVKNIQVNATTANVVIKWDVVDGASYYEVSINTSPATTTKTSSNSTSIAASELTDGESYTVTVTAKSDDSKVKESSASMTFTYTAKTVQLSTPSGITGTVNNDGSWLIQWTAVEHADYYKLSINGGEEFEVQENSYIDTGIDSDGSYSISIKACSNNPTYTESEVGSQNLTYQTGNITITIRYKLNGATVAESNQITVKSGDTYSAEYLDEKAGYRAQSTGYAIIPGQNITVRDLPTVDINVQAENNTPVEGPQSN